MDEHQTSLRRPSRTPWILLGLAVIAGSAWAIRWVLQDETPEPPPAPHAEPAPAAEPIAKPAAPAVPQAEPKDAQGLLESASPDPSWRAALKEGDLVRRWAVVTDNLAEGVSPRKQLPFLAPAKPFATVARGGKRFIAPASYARYDELGDAVQSLDVAALARAYRALHTALEGAYRALGYPGASLDAVTGRALKRVAAAPVRDGDVEVVDEGGGVFTFADPRLEELGAVEKHLLRMGPRNARIVQAKARELLDALGLH